jgi:uncharacterized membrane protein
MSRSQMPGVGWFRLLVIITLALGLVFRVAHLDSKVYWRDEALTSLRISGYTVGDVIDHTFGGQEVRPDDIQAYQHLNRDVTPSEVFVKLASDNPHHPPLYFLLARFWAQTFGDSVTALRSLSVVLSLLSIPAMYWLCRELFANVQTATVAIALTAISPFHVLYAQEARPYMLWVLTVLLSSASLLWALRTNTKMSWAFYCVNSILALYTALFSVFVIVGHCLYVCLIERWQFNHRLITFWAMFGAALFAFLPWLVIVETNLTRVNEATSWVNQSISLPTQIKIWLLNATRIFLDIDFKIGNPISYLAPIVIFLIPISFYFLLRTSKPRVYLFILASTGVLACFLVGSDLAFGGVRSVTSRYLIPCVLGVQLSVAHLLSTQLNRPLHPMVRFINWRGITALVLALGIVSNIAISQTDTWWNKYDDSFNPAIAQIVNQTTDPVLMSFSGSVGQILSLSRLLDTETRLRIFRNSDVDELPNDTGTVFLLSPSKSLRDRLEEDKTYELVLDHQPGNLWHIKPKPIS